MRRRRITEPSQHELFAAGAAKWVAHHWPELVRDHALSAGLPSPLERWAAAVDGLAGRSKAMLMVLAQDEAAGSSHISIGGLAARLELSRNTTRRHLEALMGAGLVLIKPIISGEAMQGYAVRITVDEEDRAVAVVEGFQARRLPQKVRTSHRATAIRP